MKKLISILMIVTIAALAGCSAEPAPTQTAVTEAAETTAETSAPAQIHPARDRETVYEYEEREIWCENNGGRIYGVAYIPKIEGQSRFPLVIHAHGMGSNHRAGAAYLEDYAAHGFAGYTFDFPGGSRPTNENKSDGDPLNNSAVTEASDLQAILDTAKTWDFVDPDYIFLEGGSMGGLVATMVGLDNPEAVRGMILHYPALYMPMITLGWASPDDVPETISFGDGYDLGSRFVTDLWDLDVVSRLSEFNGNVLIIQGSDDQLVSAESTKEASAYFNSCDYKLIEDAGHGFSGGDLDTAISYGRDYLFENAY